MRPGRILHFLCVFPLLAASTSAQVRLRTIVELDGETSSPSLSPDGKTLAFEWCKVDHLSCAIYTRPLEGGQPKLLAGGNTKTGPPFDPKWSPDGRKLAMMRTYWTPDSDDSDLGGTSDNHLVIRSVGDGVERDLLGHVCGAEVAWSPDSRFFAAAVFRSEAGAEGCRLALISAQTGQRVRELASHGGVSAFSPDGALLAYADGNVLKLLSLTPDYQPRGPARTLATESGIIDTLCWSRDGKQLIYQEWDGSPYPRKIGLGAGAQPQLIGDLPSRLDLSELLPDGSALATEYVTAAALWRVDLRSPIPKAEKVRDLPWTDEILRFSPDGLRLAFVTTRTGHAQIWLANSDGTNQRPLVESIPGFANPPVYDSLMVLEWSPDGKWIAFTAREFHADAYGHNGLYLVSSSGGQVRRLAGEALPIEELSWAGDGKSLLASRSIYAQGKYLRAELVRIDLADGSTAQITQREGRRPHPSADGKFLYYFSPPPGWHLSRMPVSGGSEERLTDDMDYDWPIIGLGTKYIYLFRTFFVGRDGQACRLVRFDPETREAMALATLPVLIQPGSAHLAGDGRYLYFQQADDARQRVVLVRGL
jgi:Tol biopolymer transport system component